MSGDLIPAESAMGVMRLLVGLAPKDTPREDMRARAVELFEIDEAAERSVAGGR